MVHKEVPSALEYMLEVFVRCDIIRTNEMIHELEGGEQLIDGRACR